MKASMGKLLCVAVVCTALVTSSCSKGVLESAGSDAIDGTNTSPKETDSRKWKAKWNVSDFPSFPTEGRRAAGTKADPFLAEGVVMRIVKTPTAQKQLLFKHRSVPHFMSAMTMTLNVDPELVTGIEEGDFARIRFMVGTDGEITALGVERLKDSEVSLK
jgi:hypothetical protein